MKVLLSVAMMCSIGNSILAWDGGVNSGVTGWAVAAMMFAAAVGREIMDES